MQVSLSVDPLLLLGAILALAAIVVSAVSAKARTLRVPGALLFLVIGMVVGDDGLGLVGLDDPAFVQNLGVIALVVILLEGGLTTKPTDLRLAALPGSLLATVGVLVTAGVTALGAWALLDIDLATAGLIGAVVGSTDAAAVFSVLRSTPLPRRVSATLRVESGANDPVAVMLTVGLLTASVRATAPGEWISFVALQLLGGILVGGVVGWAAIALLRRLELGIEGLYPITVTAFGALAYGAAAYVGSSGFVAVYVTGILVGAHLPRHRRSILGFHEAVSNAAEIGLFLVLGLLVFPSRLPDVLLPALLVTLVLTCVARPLAVWVSTLRSGIGWRERAVLNLGGLKGAVPIVLATFPLTAGLEEAPLIFDVVFFVVLVSVLFQGLALPPAVRWLGLQDSRPSWAPVAQAYPLEGIEIDLIEVQITEDLVLVGRRLTDADVPDGVLITALVRGEEIDRASR